MTPDRAVVLATLFQSHKETCKTFHPVLLAAESGRVGEKAFKEPRSLIPRIAKVHLYAPGKFEDLVKALHLVEQTTIVPGRRLSN